MKKEHEAGKGYCRTCDEETQPVMRCRCSFRDPRRRTMNQILDNRRLTVMPPYNSIWERK